MRLKTERKDLVGFFGSKLRVDILLLMLKGGPVYCLEIVQLWDNNPSAVQSQLKQLKMLAWP